jgi:hypothetical protein
MPSRLAIYSTIFRGLPLLLFLSLSLLFLSLSMPSSILGVWFCRCRLLSWGFGLVFHLHLSLSLLQTLLGADKALPFLTAVFLSVIVRGRFLTAFLASSMTAVIPTSTSTSGNHREND